MPSKHPKIMLTIIFSLFLLSLLISFAIIGVKLFYPYHVRIGILIVLITSITLSVILYFLFHANKEIENFEIYLT